MKNQTVWDLHPKMQICYQTTDGVKFFKPENANTHARSLKDKTVETLKRPSGLEALEPKAPKLDELTPMQKAKLRKRAIERLETIEAVKEALEGETAKSVIKAGEARIAELENPSTDTKNTSTEEE